MNIEYEVKVLDIDVDQVKHQLLKLGASYIWKKEFRRYVYDMTPPQKEKWIRLRTDGKITTLTCKHILDSNAIDGVREWEFEVWDFDIANEFLEQIGYIAKSYQENIRESYILDNCSIEIDARPLIPIYLEIEGPSRDDVLQVLNLLELGNLECTSENTTKIYEKYWIDNIDKCLYLWFDKIVK